MRLRSLALLPYVLALLIPLASCRQPAAPPVTFSRDIAPLLQDHCQKCHHAGGIAPFPLVTYADAFAHRGQMRRVTGKREMPPWHAARDCSRFVGDPSLEKQQVETIARWIDSGAREGDAKDLPPQKSFPTGWSLGEPDLVLEMEKPFAPDFSRGDVYQCFRLPTHLPEDRYVAAVELQPGNRTLLHHALLYIEDGTTSDKVFGKDPGAGVPCFGGPAVPVNDSFGEWAPGNEPQRFPDGVGRLLPKDGRVIVQAHYSARWGKITPDQTRVGVYFARPPVTRRLISDAISVKDFVIPANAAEHLLRTTKTIEKDVHLISILPHMHLIGDAMWVTARLPDGTEKCLVEVHDWDVHWQRTYSYAEPVALPKGTVLTLVAAFNNSETNKNNPSKPPRDVRYGELTTDEMCMALLFWTIDGDVPAPGKGPALFEKLSKAAR